MYKMKIFYLITKSEPGGAQTHIFQLSRYLIGKGVQVGVMARSGGWLEKEILELGGKFYPNNSLANTLNPFECLRALKEIKRAVADFKPDLISCHSSVAGFLGRVAVKNKVPTLFTAHGWAFTEGVSRLRKCIAILAEKIAVKFCSKIICVSNFDRKLALKYKIAPANKLVTIHNGVELTESRTRRNSLALEELGAGKVRIVFVGRLAEPKDPLLLLQAFKELPEILQEKVEISIVGDGPKRKGIEEFIKENNLSGKVKLLGLLKRKQVFETLLRSHIFVLTSRWEGFPRSVLEAMSCGLAIVASDVGGVKEAVTESCGFVVKTGDREAVRNALKNLLKNPELIQEMGKAARQRAVEQFSLAKMLTRTVQTYKELLQGA